MGFAFDTDHVYALRVQSLTSDIATRVEEHAILPLIFYCLACPILCVVQVT